VQQVQRLFQGALWKNIFIGVLFATLQPIVKKVAEVTALTAKQ